MSTSRSRSICAWRARLASPNALRMSISLLTKRSSCHTFTKRTVAHFTPMRLAWSISGCGSHLLPPDSRILFRAGSVFGQHAPRASEPPRHKRQLPAASALQFQKWARRQTKFQTSPLGENHPHDSTTQTATGQNVILWADTFNNYFHPETSRAALDVLQKAGFKVRVPQQHLCCGRPLYDFGHHWTEAKEYLQRVLQRPWVHRSTRAWPVVVLEPSCASVFRDEVHGLFPYGCACGSVFGARTFLLEFLERHAPGFQRAAARQSGKCFSTAIATTKQS